VDTDTNPKKLPIEAGAGKVSCGRPIDGEIAAIQRENGFYVFPICQVDEHGVGELRLETRIFLHDMNDGL
jgi:hypothetical protein